MSECREAFERNECEKYGNNYDDMKKNWDWYESQYGWRYPEDSPRGLEWKAWDKAWLHQQSKVDELQKQLIDQGQRFNEQGQRVKDLEHKNAELQKRVDAALEQSKHALQYVEEDMRGNFDFLQMAMIRTFKELKKTLESSNAKYE